MSETQTAPPRGLVDRVMAAYADPAASMRELLAARPAESVLLSLLAVAAFLGLLGAAVEIVADEGARAEAARAAGAPLDGQAAAARFQERIGTEFVARMLLFPIAVYLLAGFIAWFAVKAGGTGGGYETRAAVIWALVVSSPLLLLLSAARAGAIAAGGGEAAAWGLSAVAAIVGIYALYIWATCVAVAHEFRSPLWVMAAAAAGLAAFAGLWIVIAMATAG